MVSPSESKVTAGELCDAATKLKEYAEKLMQISCPQPRDAEIVYENTTVDKLLDLVQSITNGTDPAPLNPGDCSP
jgi:hypothetical protein